MRLLLAIGLASAFSVPAASQPVLATQGVLTKDAVKASSTTTIAVSAKSFTTSSPIPLVHSDYGEKVSPALIWTGVPSGTRSVTLVMEDPDAADPKPFVHWILYNLPPTTGALPEAISGLPRLPELGGALQGRTSRGNLGYFGPRPPKGDPPHHYHFQVFALDLVLALDPGASREAVIAAMRGHVLASGDLVGTFAAPPDAK